MVRYATRLLRELNRSRAVVVDDSRSAMGMVTLRDLVLRIGATSGEAAQQAIGLRAG